MTVTIKDIARAAGVSHSTVSRALRGHPAIAASTIARIEAIAADMGYVPSAVARGLKTKRSHALGVIVSRIDDPFFSEILQGIEDSTQERGYSLLVAASNRDKQRETAIIQAMGERRVDGLIICSGQLHAEGASKIRGYGIPTVAVDGQSLKNFKYSIYHDHFSGTSQLTGHLLELGHTRIAYLGNRRSGRTTRERCRGFLEAMRCAQLPVPEEYIFEGPDGQAGGGIAGARYFLSLDCPPSAIIAYNDMMAIGLLHAFREAGLDVPRDCSIAGFDNIRLSAYTCPPLTTFEQPCYKLGCMAAEMMLKLIDGGPDPGAATRPIAKVLQGSLIIRDSTAPPRP